MVELLDFTVATMFTYTSHALAASETNLLKRPLEEFLSTPEKSARVEKLPSTSSSAPPTSTTVITVPEDIVGAHLDSASVRSGGLFNVLP